MAHLVHQGLRTGRAINLGTFGPKPGEGGRPDMAGYLAEDEANPGGHVGNVNAALNVQRQREADTLAGNPTRAVGGPLPDMAWDAFFGAQQQKEKNAENHNVRFHTDLAGHGPGQGIGQLGYVDNTTGMTTHPLAGAGAHPSIEALQNAANMINDNASRGFRASGSIPLPKADAYFADPRAQQQANNNYDSWQIDNLLTRDKLNRRY